MPRHPRGTIRHLRGGRRAWTITRTISSPRPDRARTRPATRAYTRTMTPPPRRGTPRRTARRWRFRSEEANHRSAKRTRSATARPSPRRRRRKPKGRKRRNRARRVAVPPSPAPAGWWSRPARTRTCCLAEERAPALSSTRARTRRLARSATRRMTSTRRRRRFFARSFFAERTPNERESEIKRRVRVRTRAGSRARRPPRRASLPGRPLRGRGGRSSTPTARAARPTEGRSVRKCATPRRWKRSPASSPARARVWRPSPATSSKLFPDQTLLLLARRERSRSSMLERCRHRTRTGSSSSPKTRLKNKKRGRRRSWRAYFARRATLRRRRRRNREAPNAASLFSGTPARRAFPHETKPAGSRARVAPRSRGSSRAGRFPIEKAKRFRPGGSSRARANARRRRRRIGSSRARRRWRWDRRRERRF